MATVAVMNVEPGQGAAMRTSQVSATVAPTKPSTGVIAGSMVTVAAVTIIMWLVFRFGIKPAPIRFMTGYVPYAGLIAVTAALERFLEPLSHVFMPTNATKQDAATMTSKAQAAAADPRQTGADVQGLIDLAAQAQADTESLRTNRAIIFWAIASVFGLVISGGFGFFLLQAVAISHVNTFLDLAVTGLTIGAGTKPLHDLITGIQARSAGPAGRGT